MTPAGSSGFQEDGHRQIDGNGWHLLGRLGADRIGDDPVNDPDETENAVAFVEDLLADDSRNEVWAFRG
jgi:hypothetical protein